LSYLAVWEDNRETERRQEDFRNLVFAHDLWPTTIGPSLENYRLLFQDEIEPTTQEEATEWVVPRGQDEIAEILAAVAGMAPEEEPVVEHRV
jgi:hypothetical protein